MSSNSSQNLETAVLGSGIKTRLYKPRSDAKEKIKELVERKPELTGGEEKNRRSLSDKRPWTSAEGGATAVILGRGLLCAAVAEVLYWLSEGVVVWGRLFLKQPQALCEFDRPYGFTPPVCVHRDSTVPHLS